MSIMRVRHVLLALGFLFCGLPFSVVQAQSDEPASPLQLIQEGKRPLLTITFSGARPLHGEVEVHLRSV